MVDFPKVGCAVVEGSGYYVNDYPASHDDTSPQTDANQHHVGRRQQRLLQYFGSEKGLQRHRMRGGRGGNLRGMGGERVCSSLSAKLKVALICLWCLRINRACTAQDKV